MYVRRRRVARFLLGAFTFLRSETVRWNEIGFRDVGFRIRDWRRRRRGLGVDPFRARVRVYNTGESDLRIMNHRLRVSIRLSVQSGCTSNAVLTLRHSRNHEINAISIALLIALLTTRNVFTNHRNALEIFLSACPRRTSLYYFSTVFRNCRTTTVR